MAQDCGRRSVLMEPGVFPGLSEVEDRPRVPGEAIMKIINSAGRILAAGAALLLLPALAGAQEPVRTFDQLNTRLKVGDSIYVTDAKGREIKGEDLGVRAIRNDARPRRPGGVSGRCGSLDQGVTSEHSIRVRFSVIEHIALPSGRASAASGEPWTSRSSPS